MKDQLLIIFAKAPVPGQVKTRLLSVLSAEQAVALHKAMLEYLTAQHATASDYDVLLYCSPDHTDHYFHYLQERYTVALKSQCGSDIGQRMFHALADELSGYKKVVLIGSDAPVIDQQYIRQAFRQLDATPVVFGPAEDGGYVMVGCTRVQADWFQNISWGTDQVMRQTQAKVPASDVSLAETLWDVDRPEDLARLKASGLNFIGF